MALSLADISPGQGVLERLAAADIPQVQQDGARAHCYDPIHHITYYEWILQGIIRFQEGLRDIGGPSSLAPSQPDHYEPYAKPGGLHPENIFPPGSGMNLYDAIDVLFPDVKGNIGVGSNVDQRCPTVGITKPVNLEMMQAQWELGHPTGDYNQTFMHEPNTLHPDKGLVMGPYNCGEPTPDALDSADLVDDSPSSLPSFSFSSSTISPLPLPTPKATQEHIPLRHQETMHSNRTVSRKSSSNHLRFVTSKPSSSPNNPVSLGSKKGWSRAMPLSEGDVIPVSLDLLPYLGNETKEAPSELLSSVLRPTEDGKWKCPFTCCKHKPYTSKSSAIFHMRQHLGNCCHPCRHCPYRAYQTSDLTNHIHKHHGVGTWAPPPFPLSTNNPIMLNECRCARPFSQSSNPYPVSQGIVAL